MFQGYVIYEDLSMDGPAEGIKELKELILKAYSSGKRFRAFYGRPILVSKDGTTACFNGTPFRLSADEFPECTEEIIQKKGD